MTQIQIISICSPRFCYTLLLSAISQLYLLNLIICADPIFFEHSRTISFRIRWFPFLDFNSVLFIFLTFLCFYTSLHSKISFINKAYHWSQSLNLLLIPLCCFLVFLNLLKLSFRHFRPFLLFLNNLLILIFQLTISSFHNFEVTMFLLTLMMKRIVRLRLLNVTRLFHGWGFYWEYGLWVKTALW